MNTLIIYDTIYGHNLELSKFIYDNLLPTATLISFDKFTSIQLNDYNLLIICPCTYGEGGLTANEQKFYEYISEYPLTSSTYYYLVGIGDRNFGPNKFANAVTIFDKLFHCQATPLAQPLRVDYDDFAGAKKTVATIIRNYLQTKGSDHNY